MVFTLYWDKNGKQILECLHCHEKTEVSLMSGLDLVSHLCVWAESPATFTGGVTSHVKA